MKVKRIYKKINENNESKLIKLGTCVLTFDSQTLPEYVYIHGVRCAVQPYVSPVLQCYNCLRFNHTNKFCKAKTRCGRCGEEHNFKDCQNKENKCILCNGTDHSTISKKCPEYQKQATKKQNEALLGKTYVQSYETSNPYYALLDYEKHFPEINNPTNINLRPQYRKQISKNPNTEHSRPSTSQNEIENNHKANKPSNNND